MPVAVGEQDSAAIVDTDLIVIDQVVGTAHTDAGFAEAYASRYLVSADQMAATAQTEPDPIVSGQNVPADSMPIPGRNDTEVKAPEYVVGDFVGSAAGLNPDVFAENGVRSNDIALAEQTDCA